MGDDKLVLAFILIISIVITSAFSGCIQKQNPTASDIIEKMHQRYESIKSYKAEIHQIDEASGRTVESDYVIYFKKPDKFRIDYPSKGTITVWTSKVIWSYNGQKNEVKLRKINVSINASEPFDLIGFILKKLKKYSVTLAGEERINGKECFLLDLKPKKEEPTQIQKLWVVKKELYPAKIQFRIEPPQGFEKVFPNLTLPEKSKVVLELKKMEFNAKIEDKLFATPQNAMSVIMEMPNGLVVEVKGGKLTVKVDGRVIGSEDWQGNLTAERISDRAKELIEFFKKEERFNAMSRIIFYGMQREISNNESTKAANAFGECIDKGRSPDECVSEIKSKYPWLSEINFSDFILLYKK